MSLLRRRPAFFLSLAIPLGLLPTSACDGDGEGATESSETAEGAPEEPPEEEKLTATARKALPPDQAAELEKKLDAEFPNHGAVTGTELRVYARTDLEASVVGWLRVGSRVRLAAPTEGAGCKGHWYPIHPTGFVCDDDGLAVAEKAFEIETPSDEGWKNDQVEKAKERGALVLPAAARDAPLPYDYYLVKETLVPSYHRLPSRNEQRAALAKADRYRELLELDARRAARYLAGESDDGPRGTAVTARYLDRGFFVASNGTEVRASRRFVRTTQGRYIKQARLDPRPGGDFHGVELGEGGARLPLAWAVRTSRPLIAQEDADQNIGFADDEEAEPLERLTFLENWQGMKRMGGRVMHVLETPEGPRYLRSWFAAVASRLPRPREIPKDEAWVHVDLRQQVVVLYEGDTPVFATLAATGLEGHETPTGIFEIRRKRVTDTMADLGPEAGDDRYRVEDVPWTQYFEGSFALHAAFWHTRFGIRRSHGCVNLSPKDALRIFQGTLPEVPSGWHGMSTEDTRFRGSHVVVTDENLTRIGLRGEAEEDEAQDEDEQASAPNEEGTSEDAAEDAEESAETTSYGIGATAKSLEPWQRRQPDEVRYTIQRGGSARFVANLAGLYHHEMQELNPEVDLDAELPPETELLIYRHDPEKKSRSLGSPSHGSLENGAPLPDGPGRILKATPRRQWATRRTIGLLDAVLRAWPRVEPHGDPLLVGNLSARRGGKLAPHHTHQSGRDVDLGYPQERRSGETYNWRDMDARNLDARRTWRLLHLLQATGELDVVFIDRSLQKLLYDFAKERRLLSEAQLAEWLEYPRAPGSGSPRVQHVPGHVDHLHARFGCGGQSGCE